MFGEGGVFFYFPDRLGCELVGKELRIFLVFGNVLVGSARKGDLEGAEGSVILYRRHLNFS